MAALERLYPRNAPVRARHSRHVLFEYVMLRGVNDGLDDAQRLLRLTRCIECKFNLIVFNPHAGTRFLPSEEEQVLKPLALPPLEFSEAPRFPPLHGRGWHTYRSPPLLHKYTQQLTRMTGKTVARVQGFKNSSVQTVIA
jgi:hypothetical protein